MALFDLPIEQLEKYQPQRVEPADFDAFWQDTLDQSRQAPLNPVFAPVDYGLSLLDTYDVTYAGYAGQPVKGWLVLPRQRKAPLPCVVEYIGYGGGRGFPFEWLQWASCGYAHFVMDTRGQGSVWRHGDTPDLPVDGANPSVPGFMTQGIQDPRTYYYRRVFTDAVRAVEAARSNPAVDPDRIALTGGSQGGGITVAVSGLVPDVTAVMPDVPFLCHYRRATEITDRHPYGEISAYCKTHRDQVSRVFDTLAYFDGINFAARARGRALFSVALMDMICPPSTVYAAFNHYGGPKEIRHYDYNDHEGGQAYHEIEKIRFLKSLWS